MAVDLRADIGFPPMVEGFLAGEGLDLLRPVRFLGPGVPAPGLCRDTDLERAELATRIAAANATWGHPDARRQGDLLANPATRVVITGQQPGLFGGPLYALSKAVAAVLWAEQFRATGESAVALFWMATEDHDFRESSRATFVTARGLETFDLGEDELPLVPVGMRSLGPQVGDLLTRLHRAIPGDRYDAWLDQLARWYTPESGFGEAFARLMIGMLGERCPLLIDAQLPALKQAQRPGMMRMIEEREALAEAFAQRDLEITDAGYPLQVRPQPGTSPLFLLQGRERRRIEWREPDRFGLRGDPHFEGRIDELLSIAEHEPERLSPGVRARSAIQDAVFGTCLQVLGPGELSYLPQAAPLFDLLGVPAPWVTLRPQVLVLDERQRAKIDDLGIRLAELLDPAFDMDAWLARPEDTDTVEEAREKLEAILGRLRESALELDASLENPWSKTADQMRRALAAFGGRVTAAAARRDETARQRLEALREHCVPGGHLQERVLAAAHFPGKYGASFVASMFEQMDLDPRKLRIISL